MMMTKPTFTDEFKQGVVQYVLEHPDESKVAIAKQFGIADSTVHKWLKDASSNDGVINSRGSGNYSSDEAKEIARLKKELKDTQDALEVLKKAIGILGQLTKQDLYKRIKEKSKKDKQTSVTGMLKKLQLSKSGYYEYLKRKPCKQKIRKARITERIKKIYKDSKEIYGAPKITEILKKEGEKISEKYVGNIMRENNIKAHYIKPYTITTKDCDFSNKLKNILNRDFNPKAPNQAWCTDITYIWTADEGFVYLTSIMDLYSRKIIAWTLSKTLEVDEVLKCLETAKKRRKSAKPIVIHADRGVHYTSKKYKKLTKKMKRSYSRKGTPWDNACIESYHALIKREWLNRFKITNYEHAYRLVFEYIEGFYNTIRVHSHCDFKSPNEYEYNYLISNN